MLDKSILYPPLVPSAGHEVRGEEWGGPRGLAMVRVTRVEIRTGCWGKREKHAKLREKHTKLNTIK